MRNSVRSLLFMSLLACAAQVSAQQQVEIIDEPFQTLATAIPPNPRLLTYNEARDLVNATIQTVSPSHPGLVDDRTFYCIIHLVVWKEPTNATDSAKVDYTKWYVFRGGETLKPIWDQSKMEGARIYGSGNVAVLTIHWTQSVTLPSDPIMSTALNEDIAKGAISRFTDSHGRALVPVNGIPYAQGFPPATSVTYRIEVTQKLPAPWANFLQIAVGAPNAGAQKLANRAVPIWKGKLLSINYLPSDIVVRMLVDTTLTETDKDSIDDEGDYRFDFSVGIPVKSAKQLTYSSTNGTLIPLTVDQYTAYGLLDCFFKKVDVKTNYPGWPPFLVTGLGLTGRPWERTMLGLGFGYGKIAGFIGAAWSRETVPGATAGSLVKEWDPHPKLVFGINLSAKQMTDLLKQKK
jgi:hypothetical protein